MKALSCDVILTSASTRADGSLGLRLATPELTAPEKTSIFELQGKALKMLLQPMGDEVPEALVEVRSELDSKTPGQRLRAVLFCWWKQTPEPKDNFDVWYVQKMEQLINHVKGKLQPE